MAPAAETGVAHHPVARELCEAVDIRLKAFHAVVQLLAVRQPKRFRPARSPEQLACPTSALAANVEVIVLPVSHAPQSIPREQEESGTSRTSRMALQQSPHTSRRWCVSTAACQGHRLGQKPTDGQSCTWDRSA